MWLSGLHIPEAYLTALVQATCRKNGWPLDRSTLFTQVTKFQDADEVNERAGQGRASVAWVLSLALGFLLHSPNQRDKCGVAQNKSEFVHPPCLGIMEASLIWRPGANGGAGGDLSRG
jgi:hypothetical protein